MEIIKKYSPNFGSRDGQSPKYICLHIMAGTLIGTDAWFANSTSQVSAHYGIGLNGEIHQYVDEDKSAWANGQISNPTAWIVRNNLNINQNKISLSIEHEGQDLSKGTIAQLEASAGLIRTLTAKYGIPCDRDHIIGHYEIKNTKPNCPSTDKSIIDKIVNMAKSPVSDKEKIKQDIIKLVNSL